MNLRGKIQHPSVFLEVLAAAGPLFALTACQAVRLTNPDVTAPIVSRLNMATQVFAGGRTVLVLVEATDNSGSLASVMLQYAQDGVNFVDQVTLPGAATEISWTAPLVDVNGARFRLVLKDRKGNTSTKDSEPFAIDSTRPAVPSASLSSAAITTIPDIQLTIADCSDISQILVNEGSTPPENSPAWQNCSTTASAITHTVTSEGSQTLTVWAKDRAGNVSSSGASVSLLYDRTGPVLSFDSLAAVYAGGNSASLSWAATDALSGVASLKLQYASDGLSFSDVATLAAGTTTYSWAVPVENVVNAKLRLIAQDSVGNMSALDSSRFEIDSLAPTISLSTPLSSDFINSSNVTSLGISGTCSETGKGIAISVAGSSFSANMNCQPGGVFSAILDLSAVADGSVTLEARHSDAAGNTSDPASVSVTKDTVSPTATLSGLGASPSNSASARSVTVSGGGASHYKAVLRSGTNCTDVDFSSVSEASVATAFTFTPSAGVSYSLCVVARDPVGNWQSSSTPTTGNLFVDTDNPVFSSFQLAGGATNVALPAVTATLVASDASTSVAEMQINETGTISPSLWHPFESSSTHLLSQTNGAKNVYAWVKDAAGNVTGPLHYLISLDFGQPPSVYLTSPSSGASYSVGQTIPISWSCASNNGLATFPIPQISYTIDDGLNFHPVTGATNLANNLTATTGEFNWILPATAGDGSSMIGKPLRIKIDCTSLAGVTASAYSSMINSIWDVFIGDPWYGLKDVNASLADVSSTSWASVMGDSSGNIFYVKNSAVMKIDAMTGMVSTFAGSNTESGCTVAQGQHPLSTGSNLLSRPSLIGTNASRSAIFLWSISCGKIFSINTATSEVTLMASGLPTSIGQFFLSKNRILLYLSGYYLYKLDLGTPGNSPIAVMGDGTAPATFSLTVGLTTTNVALPERGGAGDTVLFSNEDSSKIWIQSFNGAGPTSTAFRIDLQSGASNYVVGSISTGWSNSWNGQNCFSTDFDNNIYCSGRWAGRIISVFKLATETWANSATLPFTNNDDSGFMKLGSTGNQLLAIYSLNGIQTITPVIGGSWNFTTIAGQSLTVMGNDGPKAQVGFLNPLDIRYDPVNQALLVISTGHLRRVDFANNYLTSSIFQGNIWSNFDRFVINPSGDKAATAAQCASESFFNFNLSANALTPITSFMSGFTCGTSNFGVYPPASGEAASTASKFFQSNEGVISSDQNYVYHSNGKLYFSAYHHTNNNNDVFIFSSDMSVLTRVAGVTGTGGYIAGQSGSSALSVSLTKVQQLQEIRSGIYAGDILIWDGSWLRRLSVGTEPSDPKIYDIYPLTLAPTFVVGTVFKDTYYDQASEIGGVLGTGVTYYVDGANAVHRFAPDATLTSAVDTTYSITGTTFTGNPRLALSPAGLLILQPNKSRVLRVAP